MEELNIPKHLAIIMDGNGRWATRKGLPRFKGHQEGLKTLRKVVELCKDLGIEYLTVYAFSTENFQRPKKEVDFLLGLLKRFLKKEVVDMNKNNVRLKIVGSKKGLSPSILQEIAQGEESTKENDGLILNIAFNYGGRREIVEAVKDIVEAGLDVNTIDEEVFSQYLYTKNEPDPELVIRTSGEFRLSNFLIWQIAYSEIYITDTLWPDFGLEDLKEALRSYGKRNRRYGGLTSE